MKVQSSTSGRSVTVHATPRRNYIALLRLQVRIRIQSKKKGKNSSIDNDDNGTATAAKNSSFRNNNNDVIQTTITRRRHCLLVSSNQRLRSLVLRFRDVSSCIAFTDQLVALNPPPPEQRFHHHDLLLSDQPGAAAAVDDHHDEYHATAAVAASRRHHGTVQENDEVLSYVGRLLHNEDFAALVDNLEACIASSEDGARLLEALVVSRSSSGNVNGNDANNAAIADDEESNN